MKHLKIFVLSFLLPTFIHATLYEDAEDGNTNGWYVYDNDPAGATIQNIDDGGNRVIRLQGDSTSNGYILGDWEGAAGAWNDTSNTKITWSMKYSGDFTIYIRVMTDNGARYMQYTPTDTSSGGTDEYVKLALGSSSNDGTWQTFTRDLQADLVQFQPGNNITAINAFLVRGDGLLDDIITGDPGNILPCTTETPDNLITNSCVEQSSTDWNPYEGGTVGGWITNEGHSGTHSLKIVNNDGQNSGWRYKSIPINHNKTITFGGWNKAENVANNTLNTLDFKVTFADGSIKWFFPAELQFSKGTHDWEHRELTYTFDKEVVSILPYALVYYYAGTAWFDDIYVIPYNPPNIDPIANAGADQTVRLGTSVTLNGSGTDSDGTIASYQWTEGATVLSNSASFTKSDFTAGTHTLTLTVTDDQGATATDTVTITVLPANQAPVADTISVTGVINQPINITLSGSDPDGDPIYYAIVTGPTNGSLSGSEPALTYTPSNNFAGDDSFVYQVCEDTNLPDALCTNATVTITVSNQLPISLGGRAYTQRKLYNIIGDMQMIGNSIMLAPNGTMGTNNGSCALSTLNNSDVAMVFADMDSDPSTFNSTSADITIPPGVTSQDILFAGLYWQGRFTNNTPIPTTANTVQLRLPNEAGYTNVTANLSYDGILDSAPGYGPYNDYQGIADITQRFQNDMNQSTYNNSTIWVADVQADTNNNSFGAWMMIVVYKDSNADLKNISIYDGFMSSSDTQDIVQVLSGFKTPKAGNVNASFYIFGGEGDILWDNDTVSLTTKEGNTNTFATNVFNSTIEKNGANVTNRNPSCSNTIGIDIDSYSVGITNGADTNSKIIGYDQNTTTVTISTPVKTNIWDQVFPGMFAFTADLLIPKVCYDYTIQQNGFTLGNDDNRTINAFGKEPLSINIALQSMDGDFDLELSKLSISLDPLEHIDFNNSKYSPNNSLALIPAILSNQHTPLKPSIAIGENVTSNGGTVKRLQRYYAQFNYIPDINNYLGRFDLDFNTSIDFGSGPVEMPSSTSNGTIDRCPQVPGYHPIAGSFNVERPNSTGDPDEKFPLYTQVVGKDFDFEVVAYNQSATPPFSTELGLDGYTVDVELINSKTFEDENATFVCSNTDTSIIQNLDDNGTTHVFARFEDNSSRVDLSSLNIRTDRALRSAIFRVIYLVDQNNTILPHQCTDENDESCFENLYRDRLQTNDTSNFCQTECTDGTNSNCYQCLRNFFSSVVCSRDNFAIRPASYRLTIADSNQSLTNPNEDDLGINDNVSTPVATIAAGYDYKLKGIPTSFIGPDIKARGYTRTFDASLTASDKSSKLIFDPATGGSCVDTNSTAWEVRFLDGNITGVIGSGVDANLSNGVLVKHSNVGQYRYALHDANWTEVDHRDYRYKTYDSQDCIAGSNVIGATPTDQSGCNIDTNLTGDGRYEDLLLTYWPYRFDISNVTLDTIPNNGSIYIFMNDFENDAFDDPIIRPLTMSALFSGQVLAKGEDNVTTTNFDSQCVSTNLSLNLARNMTPAENTIVDESGNNVLFQQYLQNGDSPTLDINSTNRLTGSDPDANTTIFSTSFDDGVASIRLHTNLKKPIQRGVQTGVNPVDINFTMLSTASATASSSAHLGNHIPKGSNDYNRTIRTYFSKITPADTLYPGIQADFLMTALYVDIFCDNMSVINCAGLGLRASQIEGADWYRASDLPYVPATDGNTSLEANGIGGDAATIARDAAAPLKRLDNQMFDGPAPNAVVGEMTDINITLTSDRPATVDISVEPDPWHVYNPNSNEGFPGIRTIWIGDSAWSGVGNAGKIIQMESSGNRNNQRLNW